MADVIVVYVTRSGHSRSYAKDLAGKLSAPTYEIVDLVPRKGIIGWLRAGAQARAGKATPIRDPGVGLVGVTQVVLVQPIWASMVAPPMRSWIRAHKPELAGKRISLFVAYGGSFLDRFKLNFQREFGPIAAFGAIAQGDSAELKERQIEEFVRALH